MQNLITSEKLIELGFSLFHKWDGDAAYMFPAKFPDLLDYLVVFDDEGEFPTKEWSVYSCEGKHNLKTVNTIEQLNNFVFGLTDEWLIKHN